MSSSELPVGLEAHPHVLEDITFVQLLNGPVYFNLTLSTISNQTQFYSVRLSKKGGWQEAKDLMVNLGVDTTSLPPIRGRTTRLPGFFKRTVLVTTFPKAIRRNGYWTKVEIRNA